MSQMFRSDAHQGASPGFPRTAAAAPQQTSRLGLAMAAVRKGNEGSCERHAHERARATTGVLSVGGPGSLVPKGKIDRLPRDEACDRSKLDITPKKKPGTSQSCGCDVSNVDGGNYDDNDGGLRNCSNENSEEHCGHQQRLCIR